MSYTNKTQPTAISSEKYIKNNFKGKEKLQNEASVLVDLHSKASGSSCVMWNKIFGFGKYHYLDSKGGEHTYLITGFAVSSGGFTLYNMMGWEMYRQDIEKLGKYKLSGKSCLAIKSIEDVDLMVLKAVIKNSCREMKKHHKTEK